MPRTKRHLLRLRLVAIRRHQFGHGAMGVVFGGAAQLVISVGAKGVPGGSDFRWDLVCLCLSLRHIIRDQKSPMFDSKSIDNDQYTRISLTPRRSGQTKDFSCFIIVPPLNPPKRYDGTDPQKGQ